MEEQKLYIENEGEKIECVLHKSDEPTDTLIITVHGFTGTMDNFIPLAEKLSDNGFDTLRFNFRFTTKDWNLFQNMTINGEVSDLKKIISAMSKKYKKIGIVGESLGGAISILGCNDKVNVIVLWYPAVFLREVSSMKKLLIEEKQAELEQKGYAILEKSVGNVSVGKKFIKEIKTLGLISFSENIKSPILLIHGDSDSSVNLNQSERLIEILKEPKKLEIITGANHVWKDADYKDIVPEFEEKALNLTLNWFNRWLK